MADYVSFAKAGFCRRLRIRFCGFRGHRSMLIAAPNRNPNQAQIVCLRCGWMSGWKVFGEEPDHGT